MRDMLNPGRLTEVVDIGANPIDGDPPYKAMLAAGVCRVTGFEPQADALAKLTAGQGANERYFPYLVGDGAAHTLNICRYSGLTSLLEPDPTIMALMNNPGAGDVINRLAGEQTRRLDDIAEIEQIDLLKIDIQGSEISVFQNGRKKLARAVAIETEIAFLKIYKNQPTFSDIDLELRQQGFIPHCLTNFHPFAMATEIAGFQSLRVSRQLLDGDMLYVRDYSRPETMDDEQLKHLGLIMHHCYGSFDVALRCVNELERRGAVAKGSAIGYLASAEGPLPPV